MVRGGAAGIVCAYRSSTRPSALSSGERIEEIGESRGLLDVRWSAMAWAFCSFAFCAATLSFSSCLNCELTFSRDETHIASSKFSVTKLSRRDATKKKPHETSVTKRRRVSTYKALKEDAATYKPRMRLR